MFKDDRLPVRIAMWCLSAILVSGPVAGVETIELKPAESWPLHAETHHVQGLSVSERWFWVSGVDRRRHEGWVFRFDRRTGLVAAKQRLADGRRYHPGGLQCRDGKLWLPLAEYRPRSTSRLLRLDAISLEQEHGFPVEDHLGGVAVDDRGILYAANWDTRTIYRFDQQGKLLGQTNNPTGVAYQDFEWHAGRLYAAGRDPRDGDVVDVIDPDRWRLVRRYRLSGELRSGGGHFAREGFCKFGDSFYLLPEDGPRSVVYRFPLKTKEP